MTKKEQITIISDDLNHGIITEKEARTKLLILFGVSDSYSNEEIEAIKFDAHNGLPDDCVKGYDEVKFCEVRQGKGGECKWCSNYH